MEAKSIRLKTIKAVWDTLTIKEPLPDYLRATRKITSSSDVYRLFRYLCHETKEHFVTLHLDTKNKIVCVDQVSVGSLNASVVHPREVLKTALLSSAAAIVLIHNHPSGDPEPSCEDTLLTTRLKECCELLGIRCLDHVIVCSDEYVSFADRGLI
ncbi:MAG: DNA repair protein RadC [Desulfuromonas sp.]|nr:MAG: DNA repair protein RadC [Desulfuromonas sp.]